MSNNVFFIIMPLILFGLVVFVVGMSGNSTQCTQIAQAFVCRLRICRVPIKALDIEIDASLVR
jgi:hypothetical protein